jgi:hypothetical protein
VGGWVVGGDRCVRQDPTSGLVLQDWDVPRNIDIDGEHFRTDGFDFGPGCRCAGAGGAGLHAPGGRANCEYEAFPDVVMAADGRCFRASDPGRKIRCNYADVGACRCAASVPQGSCLDRGKACRSDLDCGAPSACDRLIHTCTRWA